MNNLITLIATLGSDATLANASNIEKHINMADISSKEKQALTSGNYEMLTQVSSISKDIKCFPIILPENPEQQEVNKVAINY